MSPRDFLVEIGTEELPPKALRDLELAFAAGISGGLDQAGLTHGEARAFATPRRLAVWVKRVAARQPDQDVKRRGPPVGAAFDSEGRPTRAAVAFAGNCGVEVSALQRLDEGKGPALFYIGRKEGVAAAQLLPDIVRGALGALPIPKRMRWGSGNAEFVRPVHWVVMLLGSETVATEILDVAAGNFSRGHRFHAPKPLRISSPGTYARALRERGRILADFSERREVIRAGVTSLAAQLGGTALIDPALLDEVTALVEWPVPLAARFEERFLALPREVLISVLQDHQRYFPVQASTGSLSPWFVTVSNIESREPDKVRAGNERVVRPRLADAAFFWDQDRKRPLATLCEPLDAVIFQAKLGSVGDKSRRVAALAGEIAAAAGFDRAVVERAAALCKCDLATAMVGEFPELQGIMGSHYARADGEPEPVAVAIREHYLPRGGGDQVADSPAGIAVAIADRLDTIAGIFAIGQKPSGTKDPFGLRRAALGVVRTLVERRIELDLRAFIANAAQRQPVQATGVIEEAYAYVMERLRSYYLEGSKGVTTEMFDAVLATNPNSPLDFDARLTALGVFLALPEAGSLTAANKRIANILRKAETTTGASVVVEALKEPAEVRLYDALRAQLDVVQSATAQRQYTAALGLLAQLRPTVDAFFDQVMVMDEDPKVRGNRLALLAQLKQLFGGVADLSRLPG
jgi:glycyl-tRNA synthetase beta chain